MGHMCRRGVQGYDDGQYVPERCVESMRLGSMYRRGVSGGYDGGQYGCQRSVERAYRD